MNKKIFIPLLASIAFFGCNDDKAQEKTLLNDVIKTHDKLMDDDNSIMQNKTKLKAIATSNNTPGTKDSVAFYTKQLDNADDSMMAWMNKFNPDFTGSHDAVMAYLNTQKKQILALDSTMNKAITASNSYISKAKTK